MTATGLDPQRLALRPKIQEMQAAEMSQAQISKALGISRSMIYRICHGEPKARTQQTIMADKRRAALVQMRMAGTSIADICAEMHISKPRAYQIWRDACTADPSLNAIKAVSPRPSATPEIVAAMLRHEMGGATYPAIAKELGVSIDFVSDHIKAARAADPSLPPRPPLVSKPRAPRAPRPRQPAEVSAAKTAARNRAWRQRKREANPATVVAPPVWSAERITLLRELAAQKMTQSVAAKKIGVTLIALQHAAKRNGIHFLNKPWGSGFIARRDRAATAEHERQAEARAKRAPPTGVKFAGPSINDMAPEQEPRGCRWIDGDLSTGNWRYCQAPTGGPTVSWCWDHHTVVFGGPLMEDMTSVTWADVASRASTSRAMGAGL